MLNELGKRKLTEVLLSTFGKLTFTEEDLTDDFWSTLYISGNQFFRTEDDYIDLDFFWSDSVREWILMDKTDWIKAHKIIIE